MRKFEIDDDIICIDNNEHERYLTIGQKYKITRIYIGVVTGLEHVEVVKVINNSTQSLRTCAYSSRFLSENDFNLKQRKEKTYSIKYIIIVWKNYISKVVMK